MDLFRDANRPAAQNCEIVHVGRRRPTWTATDDLVKVAVSGPGEEARQPDWLPGAMFVDFPGGDFLKAKDIGVETIKERRERRDPALEPVRAPR